MMLTVYENFYYDFVQNNGSFEHQFSTSEDLTTCKIWRINAENKSMKESLNIIYEEIESDIEIGRELSDVEKIFYKKHKNNKLKTAQ